MSRNYSYETAHADVKCDSRKKIADDVRQSLESKQVAFHYLGGQEPKTHFEDLLGDIKNQISFIRYELLPVLTPSNYEKSDAQKFDLNTQNSKSYGKFINNDFFSAYPQVYSKIQQTQYYWLDFCCTPSSLLLWQIYDSVIPNMEKDTDSVFYATFYLNPRGWNDKDTYKIFGGKGKGYEREDRARHLRDYLNKQNQNINCEIFDLYNNGPSPMGVFKFTHIKTMKTKPRTVEGYAKLRNEGYTNKQIAVYWRVDLKQVAAWNAHAKRQKLVT